MPHVVLEPVARVYGGLYTRWPVAVYLCDVLVLETCNRLCNLVFQVAGDYKIGVFSRFCPWRIDGDIVVSARVDNDSGAVVCVGQLMLEHFCGVIGIIVSVSLVGPMSPCVRVCRDGDLYGDAFIYHTGTSRPYCSAGKMWTGNLDFGFVIYTHDGDSQGAYTYRVNTSYKYL